MKTKPNKALVTTAMTQTPSATSTATLSHLCLGKSVMTEKQIQGLEHVRYEVKRLRESFSRWTKLHSGSPQSAVNDQLELTLLHARAILDFFEYSRTEFKVRKKKAQSDDLIAEDYGWPVKSLQIDALIKKRIDKEIAHLTYFRCGKSRDEKMWRPEEFVPVLISEADSFLKSYEKQ